MIADAIDEEATEQFFVNIFGASNAGITDTRGVGTITDNDPQPTVSIADVVVDEANDATLTVQLSEPSGLVAEVSYATTNGAALAGSDFTSTSGTITFQPGEVTKTITIPILNDQVDEPDGQHFFVDLSSLEKIEDSSGRPSVTRARVSITDNDAEPRLVIDDLAVVEGNNPAPVRVRVLGDTEKAITVDYAISGVTATLGDDFTRANAAGTLTIPAGTTEVTVPGINILSDQLEELDAETISVNLSAPSNATIQDGAAIITIINQEQPTLSVEDVFVSEGDSVARIVVRQDAISATDTIFTVTASGVDSSDIDGTSWSDNIPPGEFEADVHIQLVNDGFSESTETFTIEVTTNTPGVDKVSEPLTATVTIYDDDFTHRVESAGDINGDGFEDLVIGASRAGSTPDPDRNEGEVYVLFGNSETVSGELDIDSLNGSPMVFGCGVIVSR